MATQSPPSAASLRQSARSEQDFVDLMSQALIEESDPDKVSDQLARLAMPKTLELDETPTIKEEAITKASDFDTEQALAQGFIKFTDRHVRKLKWHVSHPSLDGVESVIILYRAIGVLSQLRIARVVHLLSTRQVLSPHEWGLARELLNRTYRDFRQATSIVTTSWPEAMLESCDKAAVRSALERLPQVVRQQSNRLSGLRDKIETARLALAVKPDGYPTVRPPRYFGGDLLDAVSWKHFWGEVYIMADSLHQHVMT